MAQGAGDIDFRTNLQQHLRLNASPDPNLPVRQVLSAAEVEAAASKLSEKVFEHWHKLRNVLEQHESVLQKRWIKKSHEQRKRVLLTAWPDMAATHRPDFQALRRESLEQRWSGSTRFRNEYLFPYINLEDLVKTTNLLNYLHSRGHNTPDTFSFFDRRLPHLGITSAAIQPIHLGGHVMLFRGQTCPETYGKPAVWSEETLMTLLTGAGMAPGEGLLVLEIQEKILNFLLQCASIIVHDLQITARLSVPLTLPPPSFNVPSEINWPSVTASVATAPYRVPAQFDFPRIKALINAKLAEAEDHIWSLREDPAYFRDFTWDCSQHRPENLPSINQKRHPLLGKPKFWDIVFDNIVADAYGNYLVWNLAQQKIIELAALRAHYGTRITPSSLLPVDYQKAIDHFFHLFKTIRGKPLLYFSSYIYASPPLRECYIRGPFEESNPTQFNLYRKNPNQEDYFLWLLEQFVDPRKLKLCGLTELLDELERVTRTTSKMAGSPQNERISAFVARTLSDLAILTELGEQLRYHEPPILRFLKDEELDAELDQQTTLLDLIWSTSEDIVLWDLGTPLEKFKYPSEKRRTAATTEMMRTAEKNLDAFWHTVDEHFRRKTGKPLQELVSDVLPHRDLERTPEWIEPECPVRAKPLSSDPMTDEFSRFSLNDSPAPTIPILTKIKVKTRGPVVEIGLADDPVPEVPPLPTIEVNKRAHKVFSALFSNPMQEALPGEIPWLEFLHAMSFVGFAIEKQHGSAWLFTPSGTPQRTIIFHEPHPSTKIPIHIARRHGRRLGRAYGWTTETFVLAR